MLWLVEKAVSVGEIMEQIPRTFKYEALASLYSHQIPYLANISLDFVLYSSNPWHCSPGHLSDADLIELCLEFFGSLVGLSLLLLSGVSCIASVFYLCCHTAGRGGNPAGGAPRGG
ncbi:hypothetical protein F511_06128 [Dorcoceras hygrometricum]|uniref:Uncharacterized protein n=1 Tax=Dorcoceras hygrometricum TaxID=472368 RepID=A0A2Z7BEF8_9LAMI|nr:hypothetical protein F511_06128 [Dorcoceras hygrometricum]